jgi:hypothetical protein
MSTTHNTDTTRTGHGWCVRCGVHFTGPGEPACEHAGDPPVNPDAGRRLPPEHPEMSAWLDRVAAIHMGRTRPAS